MFNLKKKEEERLIEIVKGYLESIGESVDGLEYSVVYGTRYIAIVTKNRKGIERTRAHYEPREDTLHTNMGDNKPSARSRPSTNLISDKTGIR